MVVYGLTFVYSVIYLILPIWSYFGLEFRLKPPLMMLPLVVLALLPVAWMPLTLRRPSQSLCWGLYLLTYVPSILYSLGSPLPYPQALVMSLSLMVGLLILNGVAALPLLKIPQLRLTRLQFWWGLGGVSVIFYGIALWSCGIRLELASIVEMYNQRAEFVESLKFPANYAILWQSCVLNPLWMAYGLSTRKPWLFVFGVVGQLYFYGLGAMKALLASVALVLLAALALRDQGLRYGLRWSGIVVLGFFLPAAVSLFTPVGPTLQAIVGAVHWRTQVQTSFLSNLYYDYFATHPYVGFAEVKGLSLLMKSPYEGGYTLSLGAEFFGHLGAPTTPQANVNLWADGYANLGVLGVVAESLIAAVVFWLIDSLSRHLSPKFVSMAVSYQILTLTNGSIITGLLSQGMAIFVMLIYLVPAEPAISAHSERGVQERA